MGSRSHLGVAAVAIIGLAACDATDPPPDAAPLVVPTADAAPPSTGVPATAASVTSTTAGPTTAAPTTVPGAEVVAATCATLRSAGWLDRRTAIMANTPAYEAAGGAGPLLDAVTTACAPDVARMTAATALDDRVHATTRAILEHRAVGGDELGFESCQDGTLVGTFTNVTPEPIGVLTGSRSAASADGAVDQAVVVWLVSPGSTRRVYFPEDTADGCGLRATYFSADRTPADAAAPAPPGPPTIGDDPAIWLPALYAVDGAPWSAAPTEDGRLATYDLRALWDESQPEVLDPHPIEAVTVCPGTLDRLDADHLALAHHVTFGPAVVDGEPHPGSSSLRFSAFRRGSDGRWRLLAGLDLTGTVTAAGCGPVVPHP